MRKMVLRRACAVLAVVGVTGMAVVGCGDSGPGQARNEEQGGKAGEQNGAKPAPKAYDPPKKFRPVTRPQPLGEPDPSSLISDPSVAFAASGTAVMSVHPEEGAGGFDVRDRQPVGPVRPNETKQSGAAPKVETHESSARAVKASLGGRDLVLAVYGQTAEGTGTTPDHEQVRLQAIDPTTGRLVWVIDADLSQFRGRLAPTAIGSDAVSVQDVVVDEHSGLVAINAGTVKDPDTEESRSLGLMIDTKAKKLLWAKPGWEMVGMPGGTLVAITEDGQKKRLTGADPRTREQKWTRFASSFERGSADQLDALAGTEQIAVLSRPKDENGIQLTAVDSAGEELSSVDISGWAEYLPEKLACHDDEDSVLVCWGADIESPSGIVGLDRKNGKRLWGFDAQSGRMVPAVRTAFHGLAYGETENGPALLDARTGKDVPGKPKPVPWAVSTFAAIGLDSMKVEDEVGNDEEAATVFLRATG